MARIHLNVDGRAACGCKPRLVTDDLNLVDCQRCYSSTRAARIFFGNFGHFAGTGRPLSSVSVAPDGTVFVSAKGS